MHQLRSFVVSVWLERLSCNAESVDSIIIRNTYCIKTLSKSFTHKNCSAQCFELLEKLSLLPCCDGYRCHANRTIRYDVIRAWLFI